MTLSEKFRRIRELDKDLIPEAMEDVSRWYAIATACTPRYDNDGSQHVMSGNNKETAFTEHATATAKVNELQDELNDLKVNVLKEVNHIPDNKRRRFTKLYYIDQLTQKQIAQQSHYAYGTVRNVINKTSDIDDTKCTSVPE